MEIPDSSLLIKIPKEARLVYSGVVFDIFQWEQELFDGSKATFERARRQDSASVVAITPDNKIIVTKQEQPATGEYFGTLGGKVDKGEEVFACAKRELLEEAGMEAQDWKFWSCFQASSYISWVDYLFVAKGCIKVTEMNLDPGEKIELMELTFEEFLEVIKSPKCRDLQLKIKVLEALSDETKMKELKYLLFK